MDIIVTDVTDMAVGHICVAGWSPEEGRMVRPLHSNGHPHWDAELANGDLFSPGNVIAIQPSGQNPNRGLPHCTEDALIVGEPSLSGKMNHDEMVKAVAGSVYGTVEEIFGAEFHDKHVPELTGLRSLGAVELPASKPVRFYDDYDKLTCWFIDKSDQKYSFPISCRALKKVYESEGLAGLDRLRQGARKLHLRIGLANPWGGPKGDWHPKRAYAMVNGIFFV